MATQRGSDVLVGREDATYSGSFNIMGGMQNASLRFADPLVDYTHKGSSGLWRECIDGGGVRTVTIAGEGVVIEDAELDAMAASIFGTSARHQSLAFLMPGVGTVVGDFQVSDFSNTGRLNEAAQFSFTAESVGGTTFVPAVRDRYAMAASLVLDFVEGSYWVNGVHTTTFAAITGSSNTRASKAWYPGGWDFTNGGAITGDLVEFANNVMRVGAQGALIEESSTNQIRNPRCEGASAGTPGTAPTNWVLYSPAGSIQVVATGSDNGFPYLEVRFFHASATSFAVIMEDTTQVTASPGQVWTLSAGVRLVSGSLSGVTSRLIMEEHRSGGGYEAEGSAIVTPDATHKRFFLTHTVADADTATVAPIVSFAASGACDLTVRIYLPQIEQKAYPTSPILPEIGTPAASTRAADGFYIANGAWSADDAPGSLFADFTFNQAGLAGTFPRVAEYSVDGNNRIGFVRNANAETVVYSVVDGGSTVVDMYSSLTAGLNTSLKVAAGWAANDFAVSVGGQAQNVDTSGTISIGAAVLWIGQGASGGGLSSSIYIRRIEYAPLRQTNAALEIQAGNRSVE